MKRSPMPACSVHASGGRLITEAGERQAPGPANGTRGGHEAAALEGSGTSHYKACSEQIPGGEHLEVRHGRRLGDASRTDARLGTFESLQLFAQRLARNAEKLCSL